MKQGANRINGTNAGMLLALVASSLLSCSHKDSNQVPRQGSTVIQGPDFEMAAAIAKARDSLPQFWQAFAHPDHGETNFALKVKLTDTNGIEYLWLGEITKEDGKIFGVVGTGPATVKCVKPADRISVLERDIGDWSFNRGSKTVGNFTIRALFKYMPKKDIEAYKKVLADP